MNNNKQFSINMVAQLIGFIVNLGISFLLTPFIVKNVGSEAYGFVGLANNFVGYAQVITVALNSMAGRFITVKIHQNDVNGANKYFTSVVITNILMALLLTIPSTLVILNLDKIVNVSREILTDIQLLWTFVFLNFLISIISATYSIATFVRNKLYLTSAQGIISNFLRVSVLIITLSVFSPSVWYIGLAATIASINNLCWNIHYTKKLMPEINVKKENFDIHAIKVLLSSGIWNSFSKISSILSTGLDLLIANLYVGAIAMGSLSIAKTVPSAILALFGSLANVFAPQLTISYAKKEYDKMRTQLMSSIKFLGIFASIPVAIMLAYGDTFYSLWVPSQDASLLQVLTILSCFEFMFVLPLEGLWNVFTVSNKVRQTSIYMFFNSIVTIILVFIAMQYTEDANIKLYIIAGTSTIFSVIRALIFLPIYGAHCLNLKWNTFYPAIMKNTILVIITTLFSLLIKSFLQINGWLMLLLASSVTCLFSLVINYLVVLDKNEKKILLTTVTRK